jgi:hypothetical protein
LDSRRSWISDQVTNIPLPLGEGGDVRLHLGLSYRDKGELNYQKGRICGRCCSTNSFLSRTLPYILYLCTAAGLSLMAKPILNRQLFSNRRHALTFGVFQVVAIPCRRQREPSSMLHYDTAMARNQSGTLFIRRFIDAKHVYLLLLQKKDGANITALNDFREPLQVCA